MIEKPLLASKAPDDLNKVVFPVLASPKLDGIRCMIVKGRAVTRKFKAIPNDYIRSVLSELPDGVDGELMLKSREATFSDVSSAVMSKSGQPDFVFMAFDLCIDPLEHFWSRMLRLRQLWQEVDEHWFDVVEHKMVKSPRQLSAMLASFEAAGFEGGMIRDPLGRYKFGRSTVKEGILLKIKSFEDEEAVVISAVEQMRNENEAVRNAVGAIERSSAKEGKVPTGLLGALVCRFQDGAEFEVGTGFDVATRLSLWQECVDAEAVGIDVETLFSGRVATIKHQPPPGGRPAGVAPRFPVFKSWRAD